MLRAGLSVLFLFLSLGAFHSHGYDDYKKDKIVTDESGHQSCQQCRESLDACGCRCHQCGKPFREKRLIAQARTRKKGQDKKEQDKKEQDKKEQDSAQSDRGKEPKAREVYLSTDNTCQCEEKPLVRKWLWDPQQEPGCSTWVDAFDGPSNSQMALSELTVRGAFHEEPPAPVSSSAPVSGSGAYSDQDSDSEPDKENQLDRKWFTQRNDLSGFRQQVPLKVKPLSQKYPPSALPFNIRYLEEAMVPLGCDVTDIREQQFQLVLHQVQTAIEQDDSLAVYNWQEDTGSWVRAGMQQRVVAGLASVGWVDADAKPVSNIKSVSDGHYALVLPNAEGGHSIAVVIVEDKVTLIFLLNQEGALVCYINNQKLAVMCAIECYLRVGGELYQVKIPISKEVIDYMIGASHKAFYGPDYDEESEDLQKVDCSSEGGVKLASNTSVGHDVAIRQCFLNQMPDNFQKISLPQELDESRLPDLYALLQLMDVGQAMMTLKIDLEAEELQAFNSIQQLTNTALGEGDFILMIQEPGESTFMAMISTNGVSMTLRMLCFSDNIDERASLRASSGLFCQWDKALQVLVSTLRTGHNVKVYRLKSRDGSHY
ncbi:hypothetical protein [Endozoicomonas sp. 4G]|uniref:hypothetical protein n=1 Tax=Endozoicomonas sp. 4G TaxID=2872754 RepID=UPI002078B2A7|nr:hypothetical protein [Endozoicomonas sp. 4G]